MSQTIFPALHYRDAEAALAFLLAAFGAREHAVHGNDAGAIGHAELELAGGDAPPITLYLVVPDPDAHCARARAAGARIVREPQDTPYGSREYGAEDLEGNRWSLEDLRPERPAGVISRRCAGARA